MHLKSAILPGDYIGPEVMAVALPVLEAVLKKSGHTLEHSTHDVGGAGIDNHGKALPDYIRTCSVVIRAYATDSNLR